jgi:proline iminopeptidase
MHAAKAWSTWGRTTCGQIHRSLIASPTAALRYVPARCHYFVNNAFLEPDQLLRDMPVAYLPE